MSLLYNHPEIKKWYMINGVIYLVIDEEEI